MAFWIPTGFDRADGSTLLPIQPLGAVGGTRVVGTPDPAGSRIVRSSAGSATTVEEDPTSPEIERAEQATVMHRLKLSWLDAENLMVGLGRGTFLKDSYGNIFRVLNSRMQSQRGNMADLSYSAESISFDSPPDEFQCVPVELGIDLIKHPRYFFALQSYDGNLVVNPNNPGQNDYSATVGTGSNTATVAQVKQAVIQAILTYRDSPVNPKSTAVTGTIQSNIVKYFVDIATNNSATFPIIKAVNASPTKVVLSADSACMMAAAAAAEIITKLWNQEDSPYLTGFQIKWSQYFFAPPYLNPGGYIEDPLSIIPTYFTDPYQTSPPTSNIFAQLAAVNPQCYSSDGTSTGAVNISFLRKADEIEYSRTWFKIDHIWIGSPIGHWDNQLYTRYNRPSVVGNYLKLA